MTFAVVEVGVGKESATRVFTSQSNDLVMEDVEREAPQFPFEVQTDKVVTAFEEVPSMVELDAPQLWEFVLLVLGGQSIIDGSCGEDGHHANGGSDVELVAFAGERTGDGRIEDRHGIDSDEDWEGGCETLYEIGYNDRKLRREKCSDQGGRASNEEAATNGTADIKSG